MNDDSYKEMQKAMDGEVRALFEKNVKNCGCDCELVKTASDMVSGGTIRYSRRDLVRFVKRVAEKAS